MVVEEVDEVRKEGVMNTDARIWNGCISSNQRLGELAPPMVVLTMLGAITSLIHCCAGSCRRPVPP